MAWSSRRMPSANSPNCAHADPTIRCAPAAMYSSLKDAEFASAVSTSGQRCVVKCSTPRIYAQISDERGVTVRHGGTLGVEFVQNSFSLVVILALDHARRVREPHLGHAREGVIEI